MITKFNFIYLSEVNYLRKLLNKNFLKADEKDWSTTVSNGTYQTADRFKLHESTDGAYTAELENLSVADQATTGMYYCNLLKCSTADTSIATDSVSIPLILQYSTTASMCEISFSLAIFSISSEKVFDVCITTPITKISCVGRIWVHLQLENQDTILAISRT